jgi:6-phosphogluconolactonase
MSTLFAEGVPMQCSVSRIEAEDPDREGAASRYERLLPNKLDIILLSVGEDGHVASLFPLSKALDEKERRVVPVIGTKEPYDRMTVTPVVIAQASKVFIFANGAAKADVARRVFTCREDRHMLPACLLRESTWLLDSPL